MKVYTEKDFEQSTLWGFGLWTFSVTEERERRRVAY